MIKGTSSFLFKSSYFLIMLFPKIFIIQYIDMDLLKINSRIKIFSTGNDKKEILKINKIF